MPKVEPIRDPRDLDRFKAELKKRGFRDYMLGLFGLNTGLRISDILPLKVGDVRDLDYVNVIESKTGKPRKVIINSTLAVELKEYIKYMKDDEYLFASRKGGNRLSRQRAFYILKEASEAVGLKNIGTHSLRKTFGYHYYQKFHDVAMLQHILNHSSPRETLVYIGITDDEIKLSMNDFGL